MDNVNAESKVNIDIEERDVDIMLMRYLVNPAFVMKFFIPEKSKYEDTDVKDIHVLEVNHSVQNFALGESDIEVLLEIKGKKVMLMIEDKIDAVEQPKQPERYQKRLDKYIKQKVCEDGIVYLVAPKKYIDAHGERYEHRVKYEAMKDGEFITDPFDRRILEFALHRSEKGYEKVPNEDFTKFWDVIAERIKKDISIDKEKMIDSSAPERGNKSNWMRIKYDKSYMIVIKINKGTVEVEPRGKGKDTAYLSKFDKISSEFSNVKKIKSGEKTVFGVEIDKRLDIAPTIEGQEEAVKSLIDKVRVMIDVIKRLEC